MTKEEIAKLTIEDIPALFGPETVPSDPRYNPNNLTEEDVEAIILHAQTLIASGHRIDEVVVSSMDQDLKSTGDKRQILIKGTPGAGFTITIKDSSDCSIMEEELENVEIPNNGKYTFLQEFPGIPSGMLDEYYKIVLTPRADVRFINNTDDGITLYQHPIPTLTFVAPLTSITDVMATSTLTGGVDSSMARKSSGTATLVTNVSEASTTAGLFYVKSNNFLKAISKSTALKKVANRPGNDFTSRILNLKPLTTRVNKGIISNDLFVGMSFKGSVEKNKIVTNSLEVPNCKKKTNKFELDDTNGLFEGMFVTLNGAKVASILSVDCGRNITVSKKLIIREQAEVIFEFTSAANVLEVITQLNGEGDACIKIDREIYIPNGMVIEFEGGKSKVTGSIVSVGSGTNAIAVTTELNIKNLGNEDVTYTMDLGSLITRKPNIVNHQFAVDRNSTGKTFYLSTGDADSNKLTKRYTITQRASHGVSTVADPGDSIGATLTYVPNPNFAGDDIIKYKVTHDGAITLTDGDLRSPTSDIKTIIITVK
jgi:hypothetical protein